MTPHLDAARAHRLAAEAHRRAVSAGSQTDRWNAQADASGLTSRAVIATVACQDEIPVGMVATQDAILAAGNGLHSQAAKHHDIAAQRHQEAAERLGEGMDGDGEQAEMADHTEACLIDTRAQNGFCYCDVQYCAQCGMQAYECRMTRALDYGPRQIRQIYTCDACRGEVTP